MLRVLRSAGMGKRGWAAIVLIPLAGCLCQYGYLLWPGLTLAGMDFLNLDFPRAELIHRAFLAGRIPLWNSYEWGGCPLLAAMQGSVLYPPIWPMLLVSQPYGLQLSIFLHVAWAAVGAALLARYLFKVPAAAAAFAGIAYAGSGYYVGRIEQANIVATFAWTPWIFLAACRLLDGVGSWQMLLAVIALCILPGHPQNTVLALMACSIFIAVRAMVSRRTTNFVQVGAPAVIALVGALFLCAAQLLPTQELSALSERVWPWPDPMSPALEWRHLPALVWPGYLRNLAGVQVGKALGYTEQGLYCGIVTFPLAVWGGLEALRRREASGIALILTWIFAMLFALGNSGFVAIPFVKFVPFIAHSRGVARMLNSATLCYALLAARGLGAMVALLETRQRARRSAFALAACTVILIGDLCWTNWPELRGQCINSEIATHRSPLAAPLHEDARLYRFTQNDSDLYLDNRDSAAQYRVARLQPNLTSVQHVRSLDGYEEALLPTRAWSNILRRYNRNLRSDRVDARLLALLGTGSMLTDYSIANFGPDWERTTVNQWPGGIVSVWKNRVADLSALEDVTTTDGASVSSRLANMFSEGTIASPAAGFIDRDEYLFAIPGQVAVVHPFTNLAAAQFEQLSCASVLQSDFNQVKIRLNRPVSHDILLTGAAFAGWTANSEPAGAVQRQLQVQTPGSLRLKVNGSLQQGTEVTLRYEPFSFKLGLFVSLVTLLALGCASRKKHGLTPEAAI